MIVLTPKGRQAEARLDVQGRISARLGRTLVTFETVDAAYRAGYDVLANREEWFDLVSNGPIAQGLGSRWVGTRVVPKPEICALN